MKAQVLSMQRLFKENLLNNPTALRVILDAADIPINYCSADKKFLFVNKAYADWYGTTPEQIIGKSLVELLGEEGVETIRPYYERALRGEHFRYETEINLSNGYRYMQCSYTPIVNENKEVTGWVGIIYDMTKRYLLEKSLHENESALKLAKERAESANIAKSEFLANISHEIRTPMNAVLGLSHILKMSNPLTDKQKEMLNTLQLSAQSLLSLINDLLDFTKADSNSIDLEHIPFRFSTMIEELIAMFSVEANKKKIELTYIKTPQHDVLFMGDPLRIRQILTNLIGNALKFTHEGNVTLLFSVTPSADNSHAYAHIRVKDTGIGIPVGKVSAVFDKFVQADMSITRQYGGSGLGLAISKNLAELMGGSITLKSVLGQGSEFTLHLPLEYAEVALLSTTVPGNDKHFTPAAPQKKVMILLAEDHQPNILVATTLLEYMGFDYDIAHNGKEVLAKLSEGKNFYDIILMDAQMPILDGYTTTRLLREDERKNNTKRLPIIGVTAHVMANDVQRCFDVGMDDYIAKPFDPAELRRKICDLLNIV